MEKSEHVWKFCKQSGLRQVKIACGDDLRNLRNLDQKYWTVLSASNAGLRFDGRMLEFLDSDGDGRVRVPELLAAVEFLESKGVDLDSLFREDPEDAERLAVISGKLADLAKVEPSDSEKAAMKAWEDAPLNDASIKPLADATADASAALAAVEPLLDAFFTPAEDAPLVMEGPQASLPLKGNINPKHVDAVSAFAEKCVTPLLGETDDLKRADYLKVKAAFAPYRAWVAAKPVMNSNAKAELEDEERVVRYRMHLVEYVRNFVNQAMLYSCDKEPIYLTGTLFIDGRECRLCFHVDNEAAHSALAAKSECCVMYLKLSRPSEGKTRNVCAVVTAGTIARIYVGRNGVFYDRDGLDWEATVTKIVENQVSLREAFWLPWKKLGEAVSGTVKKFLGDKQAKACAGVTQSAKGGEQGGAAMASSVAAIGIAVGMLGAAAASVVTALRGLQPWWMVFVAIAVAVLAVSMPSVILTYLKLRRRDIGAILNACGWAVNRRMRFSMRLAKQFTRCA
jgi:hypothetical protein